MSPRPATTWLRRAALAAWSVLCLGVSVPASGQAVNWSGVGPETRTWIEAACRIEKSIGTATYARCVGNQIRSARTYYRGINWAGIAPAMRTWIEGECRIEKATGPSQYFRCINGQVHIARTRYPRIDWAGVGRDERWRIEDACRVEKSLGPPTYAVCVDREKRATAWRQGAATNPPAGEPQ